MNGWLTRATRIGRGMGRVAAFCGFAAAVVVLLLWLAGKFESKVPATRAESSTGEAAVLGKRVAVRLLRRPLTESAVGSIRAVHETSIGSKLFARVEEVNIKAGQKVALGDVLVRLNDSDLRARLQQSKAALDSATARREQAAADLKRDSRLIETNAISRQQFETSKTTLRAAEAEALRSEETVKEVQANLEWATIRSPLNGIVIDKKVDVGDMVAPGQQLATLFDPTRMQLVANVRESLAFRLQVGQTLDVSLAGLNKQCRGTISEIVPQAQTASRAFQVKVTGPCPEGIYTGMFARIEIPLDEEQILVVPRGAVRRVGQLELVDVAENGSTVRRAVRTGRDLGEDLEILSGLREGEQVLLPATAAAAREVSHG